MKLVFSFLLSAFLFAKPAETSVRDPICVQKQQEGVQLGTVFVVPESCQKCACDGSLRKFCMVDPYCKETKEALDKNPCYKGGSKFKHGSQVQVDCNICTCNNVTWTCTSDDCSYNGGGVEKEEESSCKDLDARCENWVERKGKELCDTKKYVEKKCLKSCDKCSKTVVVEEENKEEACKDKSKHCTSWSKRAGNLCQTHKTMVSKCRVTCGLCTPEGGDGTAEEENEVTVEKVTPREKTAQELEEERRQAEVDAWRDRLINEGQLIDTDKTPLGCQFDCGGTVYPWGSSLQDSNCGVCTCKRKGKLNYFFKCTNPECETSPTCN